MTTGQPPQVPHPQEPAADSAEQTERVARRKFIKTVGTATAVGLAGAGAITYYAAATNRKATSLVCGYRGGEIPLDPASGVWTRRSAFAVPLLKQNIATPNAPTLEIPEIRVRAIQNGQQIAFHLEWSDPDKDEHSAIARFNDAVAVMLSVDAAADAPIMMGGPGAGGGAPAQPAHILQWRASEQKDVDAGRQMVKDVYPNSFNDSVPEQWMPVEQAKAFYPAWAVGNPLAQRDKKSPVEELVAVGFGTLTEHKEQEADGKGVHDGRRWRVVIRKPLKGTGTQKAVITPGETRGVAFAVWSGSKGQRGARKQYALWTPMQIEAAG